MATVVLSDGISRPPLLPSRRLILPRHDAASLGSEKSSVCDMPASR